jgi:hypothetical protein
MPAHSRAAICLENLEMSGKIFFPGEVREFKPLFKNVREKSGEKIYILKCQYHINFLIIHQSKKSTLTTVKGKTFNCESKDL